jgi:multisubunit Na+/H+ antiporter MnhE subunit
MDLNFSAATLIPGFIFGVIGMFMMKKAKSQANVPWFVIGIVLMVYPYFIQNLYLLWGIGLLLLVAARIF